MEMCAKILEAAMNGDKKTHIAYNTKIGTRKMRECLHLLLTCGLINGPKGKEKIYKTTEEGKEFLESVSHVLKMKETINELEKKIKKEA
jgi:predicted transcriptional regulator